MITNILSQEWNNERLGDIQDALQALLNQMVTDIDGAKAKKVADINLSTENTTLTVTVTFSDETEASASVDIQDAMSAADIAVDIVNNLRTDIPTKALSASMGMELNRKACVLLEHMHLAADTMLTDSDLELNEQRLFFVPTLNRIYAFDCHAIGSGLMNREVTRDVYPPRFGVVYFDKETETCWRWDGTNMVLAETPPYYVVKESTNDNTIADYMPAVSAGEVLDRLVWFSELGKLVWLYMDGQTRRSIQFDPDKRASYTWLGQNPKVRRWSGSAWVDVIDLSSKANASEVVKSISVNGQNPQTPNNGNVNIQVEAGAQGQKGDKGDTVVLNPQGLPQFNIINDVTTGGASDALSAEMGRRLAMMSGTFAQAWARSRAIPFPFCFLWNETVDGESISKPIWHKGNSVFIDAAGAIVNVEAAAVPGAPTITGATSGSTVPKNTQITIIPESGSALYYSLDGGTTYNISDAAVTTALTTAGSVSIVAYCTNNKGNSSNATLNVTVAGTAVPEFTPNGGEVSRGGSVTISVPTGGELHYKVDSGTWITASGTSVSIPITGTTTIQAYNVQDGDTSDTVTKSFTMAALAAPTFSVATGTEFPVGGGEVELSAATGATIYYTTDGNTPTTSSTQYNGTAIQVTDATTIKAIAVDTYGSSEVATASYTIKERQIRIDAIDQSSSVTIGGTTFNLDSVESNGFGYQGYINIIKESQLPAPNADGSRTISFSDATKIRNVWAGDIKLQCNQKLLEGATGLITAEFDIDVDATNISSDYNFVCFNYFNNIGPQWDWSFITLKGVTRGLRSAFKAHLTAHSLDIDLSGLAPYNSGGFAVVDSAFGQAKETKLTIGEYFKVASNASGTSTMFGSSANISTLTVLSPTPPDVSSANVFNWLSALVTKFPSVAIKVPAGSLATYTAESGWSDYANNISEIS